MGIGQGQSHLFNTTVIVRSVNQNFVIRVVTTSGIVVNGAYPNQYQSTSAINSELAAGLGSLELSFASFKWYDYLSGPPQTDPDGDFENLCSGGVQCNDGTWQFDINHPLPGSLVPEGQNHTDDGCGYCGIEVPMVLSVNVTNADSQQNTVVINSLANIWVIETCDAGTPTSHCGETSPVYVFYAVNVNQANGEIVSNESGSFVPISVPYGVTKTLYFAAAYPMESNDLQTMSLGTDDSVIPGNNLAYYGQFAVFLLVPGTKIAPTSVSIYGQNVPFESTIAGDNIGWSSETPSICTGDTDTVFQLQVNNSAFSGSTINKIVLDASAFSSISATPPSGWTDSVTNGIITWSSTSSGSNIAANSNLQFAWNGLSPSLSYAVQDIFPVSIYWASGALTELQTAQGCFVNSNLNFPVPRTVPSNVLFYVPITLANLQTTAVSGGSQVLLNINWNAYSSYLDSPVDNVLFFDSGGNSLNAWMQSGSASSSTNSPIWLKLKLDRHRRLELLNYLYGILRKGIKPSELRRSVRGSADIDRNIRTI